MVLVQAEAATPLIHNSQSINSTKYGVWGDEYTCATCHQKGSSPNIKKVPTQILTPTGMRPVIFTQITTASNEVTGVFGNDERTTFVNASRNVCEVCHHRTIYHTYSASKLSNTSHPEHKSNRKDCNACHKHKYGYRPPDTKECVDCHATPPTTSEGLITNAFGPAPPPDGGAHNRHRNLEGMECHTCHNNFGHGFLGNDLIEFGFRIDKRTWSGFSGISTVMSGTVTGTNNTSFNNDYKVAPGNPGTILNRSEAWDVTCSVYCHGAGWAVPSGKAVGAVSWIQGPLGSCSVSACHGTTPVNPPNPGVPGAHQRHVGDLQQACTKCHDDYPNPHMVNGRVKWNLEAQGEAATYKGFRIHSTSQLPGVAPYGDCMNIYCHSNVQGSGGSGAPDQFKSITWGSAAMLSCDGCHGGKRTDAAPITSGAHAQHITGYAYACAECHSGAGADGSLMNHLDSNIQVTFGSFNGSYSQMPVNLPGNGYGNCSVNYCHSDGRGGAQSISWSATGPLLCDTCHLADQTGNAINSGKHTAHVDNAQFLGSSYGCVVCHANTVIDNATLTANKEKHVNRYGDYSGLRSGRYNPVTGLCTATYCHSDGKGGAPAVAVNWLDGSAINDCKGCHGVSDGATFVSAAGEPNYANTGVGTTFANSHDRHMGGVGLSTCVYCHDDTVSTGGLKSGTLHLNGMKNVKAGGGKSFIYLGNRTCSNISCHGGPAVVEWGASFPVDCTGCHGGNAATGFKSISSGKHKEHINNAEQLGTNIRCAACHALTAQASDRAIADTTVHGNGFKNFTGLLAGSRSSYDLGTGECRSAYCHSDGKGAYKNMSTLTWKSTATLDCTGCHGSDAAPDFASLAGEPNYANAGVGSLRANDHKNHVDFGSQTCGYCHAPTAAPLGGILANTTTHSNRRIDVVAGNGKSFDYVSRTCSNISCHGGKGSYAQVWGTTPATDCTGCHGNNASTGFKAISSGRHKAHINNALALGSNYACGECHGQTINPDDRTFANRTLHGNGLLNYSGSRAGQLYDSVEGNCANTYCHTDGKGSQKSFTLATGWKSGTVYQNCIGCHGSSSPAEFSSRAGEPNYVSGPAGSPSANSHNVHVGSAGAATCVYCHSGTVNTDGMTVKGNHTNRAISYESSSIIGKTFSPGSGKSCSNVACHGGGALIATWGGTLGCNSCHGDKLTLTSGKHQSHVNNAAQIGLNLGCVDCHAQVVNTDSTFSNRTLHADGLMNYSGATAGKSSGACSAAYCHSNGKGVPGTAVDWNLSPAFINCVGCHGTGSGFVSIAGEPNYANSGDPGSSTSNSHQTHATRLTWTGAASCDICHYETVTPAGTAISGLGRHLNGQINVSFNPAKAGAAIYNPDRTCSNTACHGAPAPKWGDAASAGCKTCHSNLSAVHATHISDLLSANYVTFYSYTGNRSSGTLYRYGCANCHPVVESGNHRNGTVDIDLSGNGSGIGALRKLNTQITAPGTGYSKNGTVSFTCDLVYCHSDGRSSGAPTYRTSPNWYGTFSGNKCGMCHDNPPQYAGQSHYVAASSMGNNGRPPYKESGHMVGLHFKFIAKGGTRSGFLGFSSSGNMAHGNPALSTTVSCVTCHSGIVSPTKIDTYAMNGTGSLYRCGGCHTQTSRTPLQVGEIVDTARHIDGSKQVVFAPVEFKTKAQLSNVGNALGWGRTGNYKADDSYDSFNLTASSWDPQSKTCLTACHVNQPGITWGAQLQCFSCHANQ